jgi:hypothetical protein
MIRLSSRSISLQRIVVPRPDAHDLLTKQPSASKPAQNGSDIKLPRPLMQSPTILDTEHPKHVKHLQKPGIAFKRNGSCGPLAQGAPAFSSRYHTSAAIGAIRLHAAEDRSLSLSLLICHVSKVKIRGIPRELHTQATRVPVYGVGEELLKKVMQVSLPLRCTAT